MVERPARRDDLDAVLDLFCRYEDKHRGAPDTEPADVTDDWNVPGWDFTRSTRVLEDDGVVVGYAVVVEEHADTVVDVDRDDPATLWERLLAWSSRPTSTSSMTSRTATRAWASC